MNTALTTSKFLTILFIVTCSSLSHSAPPIDPRLLPATTEPGLVEVKWKERGDVILPESICFNYQPDTSEYKRCRQLAEKRFKRECEDFRLLYHDSRPRYDIEYKIGMDKFCTALDSMQE